MGSSRGFTGRYLAVRRTYSMVYVVLHLPIATQ